VRPAQPSRALATRPPLRRLLWALHRLKSGKPLRATDLAREFEVAVRTAYRDLDFLRDEWRVPLEYDHHQGTYLLTEPVASLPLVSLSQGELLAIYFAEKVLHQCGTPFEPDLASAFAKMQELLPEEVKVSPESLDAHLSLDLGALYTPNAATFREILQT
jgi:predicted DNA-binding transcriptional regulator YafY